MGSRLDFGGLKANVLTEQSASNTLHMAAVVLPGSSSSKQTIQNDILTRLNKACVEGRRMCFPLIATDVNR